MTPVVATVVRSDARAHEWMARLNSHEREYVHRTLKRKDRTYLTQLLSGKRSREDGTAPLRIQVLRSGLPEKVRLQIFEELRGNVCDKYVQWVRRALRLPLDRVFAVPRPHSPAECVAKAKTVMDSAVAGHAAAKCEVLKMLCQSKCGSDGAGAYSLGLEALQNGEDITLCQERPRAGFGPADGGDSPGRGDGHRLLVGQRVHV